MPSPMNAYLKHHPELTDQQRLQVHYASHHRESFCIKAAAYAAAFDLVPAQIGLRSLQPQGEVDPSGAPALDPEQASINLVVVGAEGARYETARAATPARINIFRHGPHYYDVHVFDLIPTAGSGATLPLKAEAVFHAYPDQLFLEVRLHATEPVAVRAAEIRWSLNAQAYDRFSVDGTTGDLRALLDDKATQTRRGGRIGLAGAGRPTIGLLQAKADRALEDDPESLLLRTEDGRLELVQRMQVVAAHERSAGVVQTAACRIHIDQGTGFDVLNAVADVESNPLGPNEVQVGEGSRFLGYDPAKGHYTVSSLDGPSFEGSLVTHFYHHPNEYDVIPMQIRHRGRERRKIYIKHEDASRSGRVEAGIVTDEEGRALPLLVQGSKNFCGENEEPFYDPGDPAYAETYFPLVLEPGEEIRIKSYLARQHWGNHPLKQVSSLQAWMPYFQMSVGVTETACYVPFRFGGHSGISVADLRGVSGEMWTSQPQYDNIGGHRFFHYRDESGEHFLRYLATRFQMTSPNMCRWGMDYITEAEEARASLQIFEVPQTDQTRDFVKLRIDFDRELIIDDPARNLSFISIDTTTQTLRYETLGYTDTAARLVECDAHRADVLPIGARLATQAPFFALYGCRPDSRQQGNNTVLIRGARGSVEGAPLSDLAVSACVIPDGNVQVRLTVARERLHFKSGDFVELDLMIMPYGRTGDGAEVPLRERTHYGTRSPAVTASAGSVIEQFPSTVRVDAQQQAAFRIDGGFGTIPVLVEGFDSYKPPALEARRDGGAWSPVQMTAGGNEGHHVYVTDDRRFGFVFLIDSDGSGVDLRARSDGGNE